MPSQGEFLKRIWDEVINASMTGEWIDANVAEAGERPDAPFADVGPVLSSLLDKGATREELCRIVRWASFEASFILLDMLRDPTVDKGEYEFFHENLLQADPSGQEGRPGSWPAGG